jgi:hypothetical protein
MKLKINKYNNKKVKFMGKSFDSQMEAGYYEYLLNFYPQDLIELHPVFELQPSFIYDDSSIRPITYEADFKIGSRVYDVKGMCTDVFKIKAKLFKYKYPLLELILITKAPKYTNQTWISVEELDKLKSKRKKINF